MKEVNLVTPWKNETISYIAQKLKTANQQKFNDATYKTKNKNFCLKQENCF